MQNIPPIEDSYIDDIIKAQNSYNPAINKTQGVKMRELIKLIRDRLEQEIAANLAISLNSSVKAFPTEPQNANVSIHGQIAVNVDGQGTFIFAGNRWENGTLGSQIQLGGTIFYNATYNHEFYQAGIRALTLANGGHLYLNSTPFKNTGNPTEGFGFLIRNDSDGEVRQITLAELKDLLNSFSLPEFPDDDNYPDYIPFILTIINNSDNFVVINEGIGLGKTELTVLEIDPTSPPSLVTYGEYEVSILPFVETLQQNTIFQFNFTGTEITQTITIENLLR